MYKALIPLTLLLGIFVLWAAPQTWDKYATVTAVTCTAPATLAGHYDALSTPQGIPYVIPSGRDGYITSTLGHFTHEHGGPWIEGQLLLGYADVGLCNSDTAPAGFVVLASINVHDFPEQPAPLLFQIGPIPSGKVPTVQFNAAAYAYNFEIVLK